MSSMHSLSACLPRVSQQLCAAMSQKCASEGTALSVPYSQDHRTAEPQQSTQAPSVLQKVGQGALTSAGASDVARGKPVQNSVIHSSKDAAIVEDGAQVGTECTTSGKIKPKGTFLHPFECSYKIRNIATRSNGSICMHE